MEHQPTVVIVDMAHMVATHGNIRKPGMFSPFEGRLAEACVETIEKAESGELMVNMPWIKDIWNEQPIYVNKDHQYTLPVHPLTAVSSHYCLFDVFHEGNSILSEKKY